MHELYPFDLSFVSLPVALYHSIGLCSLPLSVATPLKFLPVLRSSIVLKSPIEPCRNGSLPDVAPGFDAVLSLLPLHDAYCAHECEKSIESMWQMGNVKIREIADGGSILASIDRRTYRTIWADGRQ